ncbi:MAG: EAL domain-containing protein [Clostridia bacterium]|nr:EAL domain-containing protein [Clostridia bacterium]
MLKGHEKNHYENRRRQVLIVDDEESNRLILEAMLEDHYELLHAANGKEAVEIIRETGETLSLMLLDIRMPVMSGTEVLEAMRSAPESERLPVIVLTSDKESEVESLNLGASDFIPKPYPDPDVILARVRRTIELFEDRQIISATERDALTGLYNKEFFYRYAENYDRHHKGADMDAIVIDVNRFHMINERFGAAYGDSVLKSIGASLLETARSTEGIVCRKEADTFMIYCPHGKTSYRAMLENAMNALSSNEAGSRIRLRMGVYENVEKSLDIERRFDRAKMASDTVRNSFTRTIGIYDGALHEKQLYEEQLIEEFDGAISGRQFKVYYQPKFDVRPDIPVLASAEALVRWQHPKLGMISPGIFIPLFENNGLIQRLDGYVWREAAAQIRDWKDRFGFSVPVSVNVSRIDMYDPHLIDTLLGILSDHGLDPAELTLEITESAYTQDSEQIISTVNQLRELGFKIEMDDFGTGYSSLNMISTLPIDALKLDMQFIRSAFDRRRDTKMLEIIIDIANYLSVPVIAEGVETKEQLEALKAMGCDLVQGYYFSRPVPPDEYESFVRERKDIDADFDKNARTLPKKSDIDISFGEIAHALSDGFESIYYVDTKSNHYIEFGSEGRYEDLQIERSGSDFFSDAEKNIDRVVYPPDAERVRLCINKEALINNINSAKTFSITYRLIIGGEPMYYSMKAVKADAGDNHHIVIGVSCVDAQIKEAQSAAKEERISDKLDFGTLAQALASDVESIYYVDIKSDTYRAFKAVGEYEKLELWQSGKSFFEECKRNIETAVYPMDRDRLKEVMDKERLMSALMKYRAFSTSYRLMIDGKPMFYRLKAVMSTRGDEEHMIIGVSNIDNQITDEERAGVQYRNGVTFEKIAQALSSDYFSIYYVNTETDYFIEYSAYEAYQTLGIEKQGHDFFELSRKNVQRVLYPEDLNMFLMTFTKENILKEIKEKHTFTLTYRLMMAGSPTYVHLKATRMADKNDKHIVIGISNVDDQIRREQEYAKAIRMANRDALTGVKSKNAYVEAEKDIDLAIARGEAGDFAIVICDLNDLKLINDSLGHMAGDTYIKDACKLICNVFKHSPVYRVGGDEFAAILRGGDYDTREYLIRKMEEINEKNSALGKVTVACGAAAFDPKRDRLASDVFARADAAMYEDKKRLKKA